MVTNYVTHSLDYSDVNDHFVGQNGYRGRSTSRTGNPPQRKITVKLYSTVFEKKITDAYTMI